MKIWGIFCFSVSVLRFLWVEKTFQRMHPTAIIYQRVVVSERGSLITRKTKRIAIFVYSESTLFNVSFNVRQEQRRTCWPLYKKHLGVKPLFVTGKPCFDSREADLHAQGQIATEVERNATSALVQESKFYNDMLVLPSRNYSNSMTMSSKMLGYMHYAYFHEHLDEGGYLFETDSKYCVNLEEGFRIIEKHEREHCNSQARNRCKAELYVAGNHLWHGTEHAIMQGSKGYVAPGGVVGISSGLLKNIVENWERNVLHLNYGPRSNDTNLRKRVNVNGLRKRIKYAEEHENVTVSYAMEPRLLMKM